MKELQITFKAWDSQELLMDLEYRCRLIRKGKLVEFDNVLEQYDELSKRGLQPKANIIINYWNMSGELNYFVQYIQNHRCVDLHEVIDIDVMPKDNIHVFTSRG